MSNESTRATTAPEKFNVNWAEATAGGIFEEGSAAYNQYAHRFLDDPHYQAAKADYLARQSAEQPSPSAEAAPVPASTGQEPIAWKHTLSSGGTFADGKPHQLLDNWEEALSEWLLHGGTLATLYESPVAARELDADAERRASVADQLRDALELYAESYDLMARMKDVGNTVDCTSVAYDIRRNMVDAVLKVWADLSTAESAPKSCSPLLIRR